MRLLRRVAMLPALAALGLAVPASAQFSESYKFLEAIKKKDGNEVTEMLAKGAQTLVNTRDVTTGETALHLVTARRDLVWMEFLMAKGANPNSRDVRGVTPLVVACNQNFLEGVEALIARGARLDESNNAGETPLITAVHNRNVPLMRMLLKAGADPDRADNSGRTARDYAALDGKGGTLSTEIETNARKKNARDAKSYGPSF